MRGRKVNNDEVIAAWKRGDRARNGRCSLSTDGTNLYSYHLKIGHRTRSGGTIVAEYMAGGKGSFKSQTTSCHVGLAMRSGVSLVMLPIIFEATEWTQDPYLEVPF